MNGKDSGRLTTIECYSLAALSWTLLDLLAGLLYPWGAFTKNPGCTWLSLADTEIYKIKSWQRYGPNFDFNLLSGLASALNYFLLACYFDRGLLGV